MHLKENHTWKLERSFFGRPLLTNAAVVPVLTNHSFCSWGHEPRRGSFEFMNG